MYWNKILFGVISVFLLTVFSGCGAFMEGFNRGFSGGDIASRNFDVMPHVAIHFEGLSGRGTSYAVADYKAMILELRNCPKITFTNFDKLCNSTHHETSFL